VHRSRLYVLVIDPTFMGDALESHADALVLDLAMVRHEGRILAD